MPAPTKTRVKTTEEDGFLVEDVATLKAFADPLRVRMLLELTYEPRTVKEVAAALDVGPTRLYYHVRILLKHRLIRVAGRRMVSGIEERRYQAVAKNWSMSSPKLTSAVVRMGVIKSMFDVVAAEVEIALRDETLPIGMPESSVPALALTKLWLSSDDVAEVKKRLETIMDDFGSDTPIPDKEEYHGVFAAYRMPKRVEGGGKG